MIGFPNECGFIVCVCLCVCESPCPCEDSTLSPPLQPLQQLVISAYVSPLLTVCPASNVGILKEGCGWLTWQHRPTHSLLSDMWTMAGGTDTVDTSRSADFHQLHKWTKQWWTFITWNLKHHSFVALFEKHNENVTWLYFSFYSFTLYKLINQNYWREDFLIGPQMLDVV